MNSITRVIIAEICVFLNNSFNIDADESTCLLGKNSTIDSLSVMELIAWCEDSYNIEYLLEDDLFLESLSTVSTLAEKIVSKGGFS